MDDTPSRVARQATHARSHHTRPPAQAGTGLEVCFAEARKQDLPADAFLARLRAVGSRVCGTGPNWRACCPAHDDLNPSLSVAETKEGILLVHCFAGCDTEDVLDRLGLSPNDLFPSLYALQFSKRRPQGSLTFRGPGGATQETVTEPSEEQCAAWERLLEGWPIPPYALNQLAAHLDLPREALTPLRVGYNEDDEYGPCWVFPERDDRKRVVGLVRRYSSGRKYAVSGSIRGLTIPFWGKKPPPGPIHLVEGASDVAALTSQGVFAVGRFNAEGSAAERLWLSRLLARHPRREVIVVGEREAGGVGKRGAAKLAAYLREDLDRPVSWALPRKGYKDSREQVLAGKWHKGLSIQEELK